MTSTKPSTQALSDLKQHAGFWLRFVSNHVSHAFARKLLSSGVTVAEWVVLREMYGRRAKSLCSNCQSHPFCSCPPL